MGHFAQPITKLVEELVKLPGIGPKSAQRLAFYLINTSMENARNLANAIVQAKESIGRCSVCGNLTDVDPCFICTDQSRKKSIICVVEEAADIAAMEKARGFNGVYHVLHGVLSPIEGIGVEDICIGELMNRIKNEDIEEIILATNPSLEGDATAMFLAREIKPSGISVTRIAHGMPAGAYLEYTDGMTLTKALEGRREIEL